MKDQKKPNAFPYSGVGDDMNYSRGMSLRDYFAAKAMQGMMHDVSQPVGEVIAEWAYQVADAMLKAREA
jgi:hypothetical protein